MPQSEKENIRKVAYCPHCCNKAPQRLLHTQTYIRRIWGHAGQELVRPGEHLLQSARLVIRFFCTTLQAVIRKKSLLSSLSAT